MEMMPSRPCKIYLDAQNMTSENQYGMTDEMKELVELEQEQRLLNQAIESEQPMETDISPQQYISAPTAFDSTAFFESSLRDEPKLAATTEEEPSRLVRPSSIRNTWTPSGSARIKTASAPVELQPAEHVHQAAESFGAHLHQNSVKKSHDEADFLESKPIPSSLE